MLTNRHHTLGLGPFRRAGCKKAFHYMHNKVQTTLDGGEVIDILISVVLNHLDYAKVKIISPGGHPDPIEPHKTEYMACLDVHLVRMNEVTINHALTVHDKGLY